MPPVGGESDKRAQLGRALGADARCASVRRRRLCADAHRRGDGHAGGGAVRPQRRRRMGAVAGTAPHRRLYRTSLPPLRQRRLRWGQGIRVPHDAAVRTRARRAIAGARRNRATLVAMRLAIIRQSYTPYGGAERFVEGALEALLERGIAITLYTRRWPQTRLQLIEPVLCNPLYLGRLWRDWGFARAVCGTIASRAR